GHVTGVQTCALPICMNPDPLSDAVAFLLQPAWTTGVFWLLGLASIAIALYAFATIPSQRHATYVCDWAFRVLIGCMWWQQTLWRSEERRVGKVCMSG